MSHPDPLFDPEDVAGDARLEVDEEKESDIASENEDRLEDLINNYED